MTIVFVLWSLSCTRRHWVVVILTCAAGNWSESSYGSSGIHCLCSKHHRIYSGQWKMEVSHYFTEYHLLSSDRINTTHPFKGENPAATSYAQQNIEGPSVTPRHHVCCALTDLVDNRKTSQCFHNLVDDMLLPTTGEWIREHLTQTIKKMNVYFIICSWVWIFEGLTQWACWS